MKMTDPSTQERKKTRYLIIGCSRSGTTVTHLALMGHPNVCALNDELKPDPFFYKGISTFTFGNDSEEEKTQGYSRLFDAMTLIGEDENTLAHGAKIACNSPIHARRIVEVIQKYLDDTKIIVIRRKDMIALYGSGKMGAKTGIMHSWDKGADNRRIEKINLGRLGFIAFATKIEKMYEELDPLKETNDVLDIFYEDLIEDDDRFYERIFRFLELPEVKPTWLPSKKVLPPPQEYISNYDSLKEDMEKIREGNVPRYTLFLARVLAYLRWNLRRFL